VAPVLKLRGPFRPGALPTLPTLKASSDLTKRLQSTGRYV